MDHIPTFAINLKRRTDRKDHILKQFENKPEFKLKIVEAVEHENGALGLWKTIIHILTSLTYQKDNFIIICEDDHEFTVDYSPQLLLKSIQEANDKGADVLFGGISYFSSAFPISDNLFWVQMVMGTQFMIIFKRFKEVLISNSIQDSESIYAADYRITMLSNRKFVIHPFVSIQKEFGYSDVTPGNEGPGFISSHFHKGNETFRIFQQLFKEFKSIQQRRIEILESIKFDEISIPVFVINTTNSRDHLQHILKQFYDKPEFEVNVIESHEEQVTDLEVWMSIRKIVEMAIERDEEMIVICKDDHVFTDVYNRDSFLQDVVEAYSDGADFVNAGPTAVGQVMPISKSRFWVSSCFASQFIILYKKIFQLVLDEPFDDRIIVDRLLSDLAPNKMILFPSISIHREHQYSGVSTLQYKNDELVMKGTSARLELLSSAYLALC